MDWGRIQIIIIPLLFALAAQAQAVIPQTERDALLALYTATDGANWHTNTGWKGAAGTECTWYGVGCDSTQTTVTTLDLKANHLKGPLPAQLSNLTHLLSSDFRYNAVYSDEQSLLNFLDAGSDLPGSVLDTQTLDADGLVFSNVTRNSFTLSWSPVAYQQEGGYRVYMAEQIDSEAGSLVTDYVPIADIAGKTNISTELTGLEPCRQYFIKLLSYTSGHSDNPSEVQSDGGRGAIVGTIPGFDSTCKLVGSPSHDVFKLTSGGMSVNNINVLIAVASSGSRSYEIVYPGEDISVGSIDGASGNDEINIIATNMITVVGDISGGSILIDGASLDLNGSVGGIDSSVIISAGGSLGPGEITITGSVMITDGSALTYGEGTPAITSGFGIHDVAEDALTNSLIATVSVKFIRYSEIVDPVAYQIAAGNDDGVFSIDNKTGEISLVKPLDFEKLAQYVLDVSASDSVDTYVGKVTINVSDVAEAEAPAGCTMQRGAAFDPVWLFMLLLAGFYQVSRSNRVK